jgi:hypothetical protein
MARVIECSIEGTAPLLQHRFDDKKDTEKAIKVGGKRDYSGAAEASLYRGVDGVIYQPSTHIEGAMLKAASNYQIGGRGKKTYRDLFKSAVLVSPDAIPHKIQDFTIDRRAVIVMRARIMRERPLFAVWGLDFEINIMDDQIPDEVVNQILCHAGQYVGIGDFRPKFGRFMVTKFLKP